MRASTFKILFTLFSWTGFLLAFEPLSNTFGTATSFTALVLATFTAWLWGDWVGLVSGPTAWLMLRLLEARPGTETIDLSLAFQGGNTYEPIMFVLIPVAIGSVRNLRKQVKAHKKTSLQAQLDPLTGLLNRSAFIAALERLLGVAMKTGEPLAVLFVDLDRFKFINDTYGHEVGDELLREVARSLKENVREQDLVARLGGDEFVLALRGFRNEAVAGSVARKLVGVLNAPIELRGKTVQVSASIGVSIYPKDGDSVEVLLKSADSAMYQVKEGGKNAFVFSTVELRSHQSRQLQIESLLRQALQNNELALLYQPQIDLREGTLVGFEALLRWESRELGMIPPDEFIPIAEDAGLIIPIGHWLLREACHQVKTWEREGFQPVRVAVNVSTLQFRQPNFLDLVARALEDSRLDPRLLEIEVTESVLFREFELGVRTLRRLQRMGVAAVLDDFGTGYSSLAYLQRLPVGLIKIDRSFISTLQATTQIRASAGTAIVEAICMLAGKLGKKVLAEGVETEGQRRYLLEIGCDFAQGFLFSKAIKPYEAERLLARASRRRRIDPPGRTGQCLADG